MIRYIFAGSPPIAASILEILCTQLYPPLMAVTQEPKPAGRGQNLKSTAVEAFARDKKLSLVSTSNINAAPIVAQLQSLQPDLILAVAFGQIFKEEVLSLPKLFCLNIHASLLPKYRGAAPIQWAIWNGETETGITLQKMVKELDAGDVLIQKTASIHPEETAGKLLQRLVPVASQCAMEAIRMLETGQVTFTPQDPQQVSYAPKIERSHATIDWNQKADFISNQIRALQPWPVAETRLNDERLKIFKAKPIPCREAVAPSTILTDSKFSLAVKCGDNQALSLTEIQLENRKKLDVKDFLKAYRGSFPHSKMGSLQK